MGFIKWSTVLSVNVDEFDSGNTLLSIDVMLFPRKWLNGHIPEEDKKYGPYLNSKGVK